MPTIPLNQSSRPSGEPIHFEPAKHESASPMPNLDISEDRREREGESGDSSCDHKPQREVDHAAPAPLTGSFEDKCPGGTSDGVFPEPSQHKSRSQSVNSARTMLGRGTAAPSIVNRKRRPSHDNGPTQTKRHHQRQQKSTRQSGIHANPSRCSPGLQSTPDQISTVTRGPSTKHRLLGPFRWHVTDTDLSCDCTALGRSSSNVSSTLIEITFRPKSRNCSSYSAVIHDTRGKESVPFGQLAHIIQSFGPIGTINNLAVQQLQSHFLFVIGDCWPASPNFTSLRMTRSIDIKTCPTKNNAARPPPLNRRISGATSQGHRHESSNDDNNLNGIGSCSDSSCGSCSDSCCGSYGDSSSDSGIDSSSEDNECSGDEPEQSCLNLRKNVPWDEIDEQRLRVYRKEGKPWKWIFKQFPTRTEPAIRMRWTMIQQRSE